MNIGQLAKRQQMLYNIINKTGGYSSGSYASQLQALSSGSGALNSTSSGTEVAADSLLQQMGVSGLEGRTIREMAKYKLEQAQNTSQTTQQSDTGLNLSSLAQQFPVRAWYTPISNEATEAMQNLALQDAMNSVGNTASSDSSARVSLIQEQLDSVAPTRRLAAFNTMNKVWQSELDRIGEYIKQNDSSWNDWGDTFDTGILKDYKPGVNVWT